MHFIQIPLPSEDVDRLALFTSPSLRLGWGGTVLPGIGKVVSLGKSRDCVVLSTANKFCRRIWNSESYFCHIIAFRNQTSNK